MTAKLSCSSPRLSVCSPESRPLQQMDTVLLSTLSSLSAVSKTCLKLVSLGAYKIQSAIIRTHLLSKNSLYQT